MAHLPKDNRLTQTEKDDNPLIDEEVFWLKNERNLTWSSHFDSTFLRLLTYLLPKTELRQRDRAGLDVSGTTTDILSDCLDTLRVNDADSITIEDMLWLTFAVVFWDAGKCDNKICVRFSRNSKHTPRCILAIISRMLRLQTLTYAIQFSGKC